MRVQAAWRQSTRDSWPTSSILGPTSRRLGMALVAIGVLWAGVLWVILTPPREAVAGLGAIPRGHRPGCAAATGSASPGPRRCQVARLGHDR